MDFRIEEFEDMTFNPMVKGNRPMIELYPVLKRFLNPEMHIALDQIGGTDKVLRVLAFMFDPGTPLKRITNYQARKKEAMLLARYKTGKLEGGWGTAEGKFMYEERDPIVHRIIVLFVRQFRSPQYTAYVAYERAFHRATEQLIAGTGTDSKTIQVIEELRTKMAEAEKALYSGKPSEAVSQETLMVMEEEMLNISPENIAERLKLGQYIKP